MKKFYIPGVFIIALAFMGCSKDFLKKYDERIIGTWRISDVNRVGIGGNTDNLPFREGTLVFGDGGVLTYTSPSNVVYTGSWDIVKKYFNDETVRSLQITAVDYSGQEVKMAYYDDMVFTGTDHFKAQTVSGLHTYITHFRR